MTSCLKIEPLQRKHMEEVIALLQLISVYEPEKNSYSEIWENFISQQNVYSVVAILDGILVGYGSVVIEYKIRGGKMAHVEDVATCHKQRNKGIGKAIIFELCEIAKKNACYKIALQCKDHNIQFYEKSGYSVNGKAMQKLI